MTGPLVKVCGLARPADARLAVDLGAAFGGVIGYPDSPRFVEPGSPAERAVLEAIPPEKRVWVSVAASAGAVAAAFERGYAFAQIHFDPQGDWAPGKDLASVDPGRLWLAPRLPGPDAFGEDWIGRAAAFVIDGFSPGRFGGTGKTVDGSAFARLRKRFPGEAFVLAGGISPENVEEILARSGADRIDANSGVESAPGVKDPALLRRLFAALPDRGPAE